MAAPGIKKKTDQLRGAVETAVKRGASAAKIRLDAGQSIDGGFESGRLKKAGARQYVRYSVEVLADGRKGIAAGNDLQALDEMVRRAVALAKVGSAAHFEVYPPPGAITRVRMHSPRTAKLTRERLIDGARVIVDKLKAYDADMDIHAGGSRNEGESLLVTTGGVCHHWRRTHWSLGCHVQRTQGTDMLFAGYGRGFGDLNEFYDPDYIAEHVLQDLRRGEKIVKAPLGRVPAYFPPEAVQMLAWPILMGVNGRNVAKGDSPLKGRLGEQVLDPCVTVLDDPHRDFYGCEEIDGDGVPTRKVTIFENGVLKNFLYDLDTAGLAGAAPTGHSGCAPHNPVVTPGQRSSDELLADIDDGLYVKELMGYGQSNILNGDFSCNVGLGFRVRKGEIVGRVKNTMVAGNLYELLKENVRLSSDVDPVSLLPHAVIDGVSVSAAGS